MTSLLRLALEEDASGTNFHEIEYVFYARIPPSQPAAEPDKAGANETDPVAPNAAVTPPPGFTSTERHEQWELKIPETDQNAGHGTIRIRRTTWPHATGKGAQYVLTTKVKLKDGTNSEVPVETSEDNFRQFRVLAASGMLKDRYTYPVTAGSLPESMGHDLKWEVDFFPKRDCAGSTTTAIAPGPAAYHPWVKIDLEVRQRISPLAPTTVDAWPFPFEAEEWIVTQKDSQTPEEQARIDTIYETCFLLPNPYIKAGQTSRIDEPDKGHDERSRQ
jgi:hypothetical protein